MNCDLCKHKRVCKYVEKARELFRSDFFFDMFRLRTSNRIFEDFLESEKECQFYLKKENNYNGIALGHIAGTTTAEED